MNNSPSAKTTLIVIIVLILLTLAAILFVYFKSVKKEQTSPFPSPSATISSKISPSSTPRSSASPSATLSPSTTSAQSTPNYQIPQNETYEISSIEDTNGDGQKETLVVTKTQDNKYHAYILSASGSKLFDMPDLGQKPLRITTQIYNAEDKYVSWMVIFTEQSGNLAFIHWNGTKYEIPQENLGI